MNDAHWEDQKLLWIILSFWSSCYENRFLFVSIVVIFRKSALLMTFMDVLHSMLIMNLLALTIPYCLLTANVKHLQILSLYFHQLYCYCFKCLKSCLVCLCPRVRTKFALFHLLALYLCGLHTRGSHEVKAKLSFCFGFRKLVKVSCARRVGSMV